MILYIDFMMFVDLKTGSETMFRQHTKIAFNDNLRLSEDACIIIICLALNHMDLILKGF